MASQSSEMLGSNFTAMLEALALGVLGVAAWPRLQVLGGAENFGGEHWDDPVVKPAIVARGGAVVWDPNPPRQERGARGARKRSRRREFLLRYASLVSASKGPRRRPRRGLRWRATALAASAVPRRCRCHHPRRQMLSSPGSRPPGIGGGDSMF